MLEEAAQKEQKVKETVNFFTNNNLLINNENNIDCSSD